MFVLNILFVLFCATSIRGEKQICATTDSDCLTEAGNEHYLQLVMGSEGLWNYSDPLFSASLVGKTTNLTYTFTDVTVTGMKNGTVELIRLEEPKFWYNIKSAQLFGEGDYQIDGYIGETSVQGEGHVTAILKNYEILLEGTFSINTNDSGDEYLIVEDYTVEFNSDGVEYDFGDDLIKGDAEKSAAANAELNENSQVLDETITRPHMKILMETFMQNVKDFCKNVPMSEIFSREV